MLDLATEEDEDYHDEFDDNDHSNDYKEDDNDQMIITLKHNKRLKKETLFMWIMKELLR